MCSTTHLWQTLTACYLFHSTITTWILWDLVYDDVCYFWSWQRWRREINLPKSYYFSHSRKSVGAFAPVLCSSTKVQVQIIYVRSRRPRALYCCQQEEYFHSSLCWTSKRKRNENNRILCGIGHRPLTQLDTYFNYRTLLAIYKNIMYLHFNGRQGT